MPVFSATYFVFFYFSKYFEGVTSSKDAFCGCNNEMLSTVVQKSKDVLNADVSGLEKEVR